MPPLVLSFLSKELEYLAPDLLGDPEFTSNIYTANYATFPLQRRKITVQICGNFRVIQYVVASTRVISIPLIPDSSPWSRYGTDAELPDGRTILSAIKLRYFFTIHLKLKLDINIRRFFCKNYNYDLIKLHLAISSLDS